jgi:hypothetical protein
MAARFKRSTWGVGPEMPMGTTDIGYRNRSQQIVQRATGVAGNDRNQLIYVMKCEPCGHEYASNGSDIWQRKCPRCQGGKPGPAYEIPG